MELELQQTAVEFLKKTFSQIQNQEETLETVIPDSMPDAERILDCWGLPQIRSREWRTGGMTLSGGVDARILYLPVGEETPQVLSAYLPFSIKWDQPMGDTERPMRHDCRIRSMDARLVNSRKILIRANLTAKGEVYERARETGCALADKPEDLQVLQEEYPLLLPVELTEKSFLLDEDLDLPGTCPPVEQIVRFSLQPELTDQKVMGGKGVFKGFMLLHMLYLSPEKKLCAWDMDVPFSQYTDLEQEFDEEEELQATILFSAEELSVQEDPRRLRLRCSVIAQCLVVARKKLMLLRDAYDLRREMKAETRQMELGGRIDRQLFRQQGEFTTPMGGGTVLDAVIYPEFPRMERKEDRTSIEAPFSAHILYEDESGKLQSQMGAGAVSCETLLAENCGLEADSSLNGRLQWSVGGGNCTLRGGVTLTADSFARSQLPAICALELGDDMEPDPSRPSVILRTPAQEEGLWELAKSCGSTVEAIRSANLLEKGAPVPDKMLLIPVL